MLDLLSHLFFPKEFIPHGHCYLWRPDLVWLHLSSDLAIAVAYYSIPLLLIYFVRQRQDVPFQGIFWLFSAFIISCGTTHILEIWTLWHPAYWVSGVAKAITAAISLMTALEMVNIIPKALALPSPQQLAATNQALEEQIKERQIELQNRQLAEAALQERESILRSFYNSTAMMMGVVEVVGEDIIHLSVNTATANFFGISAESIQNQLASRLGIAKQHLKQWLDHYRVSYQQGKPVRFEYTHQSSGGERFLSATVCPITPSPFPPRFSYVVEDATDRKQAEIALRQQATTLREQAELLELANDTILVRDMQGRITFWNHQAEAIYGWTKAEALYQVTHILLKTEFPMPLEEILATVIQAGRWEGELIHYTRAGQALIVASHWALQRDEQGNPSRILEINTDITDRKAVEASLRQAYEFEAALKRVTDKVRDSLDENQIMQTAVQEVALLLKVDCCDAGIYNLETKNSTIQAEYSVSLPSATGAVYAMADFAKGYDQLLQGETFQFCTNPKRSNVQESAILACPILDDQGVLGDIWLFKAKEQVFSTAEFRLVQQVANQCAIALRQARLYQAAQLQVTELERLNRLKDDFLSTVSHELRTPMSNIKMAIQMLEIVLVQAGLLDNLEDQSSQPSKANRYFKVLQDESQREISLINDLLDLSLLEAGTDPLLLTPINFQAWATHVAEPFTARSQSQQQQLYIHIPSNLPTLTTDLSLLEAVLTELLNNACKYTPSGETITLQASATPHHLQFSVNNSGTEIPPEEQERVFDKFYRIPNSDPWKYGGTGLGLALVQRRIARLGGNIQICSGNNQTTFMVELPLLESPVQPAWGYQILGYEVMASSM